jgi:hypothetical protein
MPSKKQSPATVGTPTVSPQKGIELIQEQIEAGNHLIASGTLRDAPYHTWQTKTGAYLQKIFGPTSPQAEEISRLRQIRCLPRKRGRSLVEPDELETRTRRQCTDSAV